MIESKKGYQAPLKLVLEEDKSLSLEDFHLAKQLFVMVSHEHSLGQISPLLKVTHALNYIDNAVNLKCEFSTLFDMFRA